MFEIYKSGVALARNRSGLMPLLEIAWDMAKLDPLPLLALRNLNPMGVGAIALSAAASLQAIFRVPEVKFSKVQRNSEEQT